MITLSVSLLYTPTVYYKRSNNIYSYEQQTGTVLLAIPAGIQIPAVKCVSTTKMFLVCAVEGGNSWKQICGRSPLVQIILAVV